MHDILPGNAAQLDELIKRDIAAMHREFPAVGEDRFKDRLIQQQRRGGIGGNKRHFQFLLRAGNGHGEIFRLLEIGQRVGEQHQPPAQDHHKAAQHPAVDREHSDHQRQDAPRHQGQRQHIRGQQIAHGNPRAAFGKEYPRRTQQQEDRHLQTAPCKPAKPLAGTLLGKAFLLFLLFFRQLLVVCVIHRNVQFLHIHAIGQHAPPFPAK